MSATHNVLILRRLRLPDEQGTLRQLLAQAAAPHPEVVEAVAAMAHEIAAHGDSAVATYTERYDRVDLGGRFRVTSAEIDAATDTVPREVRNAIELAHHRLVTFHEQAKPTSWTMQDGDSILGQRVLPIRRVGVYAPGGTAAYVSTVLMDVVPAQVAGCTEIALCSSPKPECDRGITPVILAACKILGVPEVYRIGGAQAVLALAIGTRQVPGVDMICGPGNIWVTEAKRWAQMSARVKIDKLAGPTEVLIIADESADPAIIAADLLAQAEHDVEARPLLATTHPPLIEAVEAELGRQLIGLPRREIAERAVREHGWAIEVPTLEAACDAANEIAPEHLELLVRDPDPLIERLINAGALFVGPYSPEALGDYVAGPNHVLPTVGTARFASPLQVWDFVKTSSLLRIGPETFAKLAQPTVTLARAEGLEGHARSVLIRDQR